MNAHPTTERGNPARAVATRGARGIGQIWAIALALGPAALLLLNFFPEFDIELRSPETHFIVVTLCTVLALALAAAVLNAARRHGDGRALLVGASFLVIAAIFSIHAIATPDMLFVGRGAAVSWSGVLSLALGGVMLALSGLPISPEMSDWLVRRFWLWLGLLGLAWLAYAVFVLVLLPPTPTGGADAHAHGAAAASTALEQKLAVGLLSLVAYGVALWQHGTLYRQRPSAAGLALLGGIALLGEALLAQLMSGTYRLSFWLFHLLEFAGCAALAAGAVLSIREGAPGAGLIECLLLPGTTARLREGYARALDRLVEDLEHGAAPGGAAAEELRLRFGLSETQMAVFERAAAAVAEERQRRRQIEQLNASLQRIEQEREQLAQLLVHDLKNPITAIAGYLDFMRMGQLNDDQAELVGLAQRSVTGLQDLVNDLLDVSRLEAGQFTLQRGPLKLETLLQSCAEQLAHWAGQEEKKIKIAADPALPALNADRRLLERLVLNLLSNAIKHTPAGTTITLRTYVGEAGQGCAVLEVADDGPGIPADRLARIFDKYASNADGPRQRNSGLGLTLCRLVAEAHGGQICASSVLGAGTVFRVELPVVGG